jgi:hypothetical protein
VCTSQPLASAGEALAAVRAGLAYLNGMDAADLPGPVQADCLRELAKAEAAHTAAHARVLAAFTASGGHEDDGQHTARAWLKWQTQISSGAAAGAVGWTRRLAAHPAISQALAEGAISPSWARAIAGWTDLLPGGRRASADEILLAAGAATNVIPPHLRRAVTARHRHCAFPGCEEPARSCHVHHLRPSAEGGPTELGNLVPLCAFHHLIAIHRQGWTLTRHADGTTTAASPDGKRILHSHGPPPNQATELRMDHPARARDPAAESPVWRRPDQPRSRHTPGDRPCPVLPPELTGAGQPGSR